MGLFTRKKPEETSWFCKGCTQEVAIKDIGAVMKEGEITFAPDGSCEDIVSEEDEVLCSKCSMQFFVRMKLTETTEKKRPLTVVELRGCEEQLRSDNLNEVYLKIKDRENIPDNSARYDSMAFDDEGKLFVGFTCPKCSKETKIFVKGVPIKTSEQQLEYYLGMHEKIPMACPSCTNNFTLWK